MSEAHRPPLTAEQIASIHRRARAVWDATGYPTVRVYEDDPDAIYHRPADFTRATAIRKVLVRFDRHGLPLEIIR